MKISYERHAQILLGAFALLFLLLGLSPRYRQDWVLENSILVPGFLVLFWGWRHRLFSPTSHTLIFVFLCLHEIGTHYTYSEVPYDDWFQALTGHRLNDLLGWQRNHYDRLLHFLYGLLCAYPFREILVRVARVRGFWSYFLPLDVMLSTSAFYELIEWSAAMAFGGDLGDAYVGMQGDVWDAQKDMALAGAGGLLAMIVTVILNKRSQKDFASDWSQSLEVTDLGSLKSRAK